jgi:hypothetical protein
MSEGSQKRSAMKPTSEDARRWAELLRQEVEQWPAVSVKRAFGMTLMYRSGVVFAALPGSRALYEEDALLLKFAKETSALTKRIAAAKCFVPGTMAQQRPRKRKPGEGQKWRIYLLGGDAEGRAAVEWLALAYESAGKGKRSR